MPLLPSTNGRLRDPITGKPSEHPAPPLSSRWVRVYLTFMAVFLLAALALLGGWVYELVTGTGVYPDLSQ